MNEIATQQKQLPDTLEDLSKFVLVGREKLNAVRAEIRAIEKVQLAAEVHEQKLQEAQEIAEAVLDAETKLGELTSQMETAQGKRKDLEHSNNGVTKSEQLEQIGLSKMDASRFETLASHPEQVEKAKVDARANGRIVTRQDVLNRIAPPKSQQQSMREFKEQAREEHEAFQKASKESVVGFDEIKKNKSNEDIIALDVSTTINKALRSITGIEFIEVAEINLMIKKLEITAKLDMLEKIREARRVLNHLERKIGGEK